MNFSLFATDTPAIDLTSFIPTAPEFTPAPAAAPAKKHQPKHFYRCNDCLTVAVTLEELPRVIQNDRAGFSYHFATCDACGGEVEYMGRTHIDNCSSLVATEYRCACDGRCTSALGPSCDCKCGGENHGTGRVVEVIVSAGKLPRLMTPPSARRNAEQFRAAVDEVSKAWDAKFGAITREKRETGYIQTGYYLYTEGQRTRVEISKAKAMKSHSARLKALYRICGEIKK